MTLEYRSSRAFALKTLNFPTEIYRIDDSSTHIFKYMYTLLELGLGQLVGWQDEANVSESLYTTKFSDLDALFGFTGIYRLPTELYPYDPYQDQLTSAQWNEIYTKDALFRIRITKFFQALLRGGTLEGISMIAEAACGTKCQVLEMWRVISGVGLATGLTIGRTPALNLAKEFVIIPLEDIDDNQRVAIIHMVDLLKPVNTIATVHTSPTISLQELDIDTSSAEDYFFEARKTVTATDDLVFSNPNIWVDPNAEVEAPTFALTTSSAADWSLNEAVTSIKSFVLDDQFLLTFATLIGGINASVTTLVADEVGDPGAPAFSIMIDDEQIFVSDRLPVVGSDTEYTYTIARAQGGTTAASHLNNAPINNGIIPIYGDKGTYDAQFGPFRPIPLADSPDNFPSGQFSGNPAKYDSNGNYVFDYNSQTDYVAWFTLQIQAIGGEISGADYRVPITIDDVAGVITTPEDALAAPELDISNRVFPARRRILRR